MKQKSSKVKVAVGMCIKNSEATIKHCIKSLLEQNFPMESMELIIVDGYSSDNTLKIIYDLLKNAGVSFRVFFEDKGLGYARQMVVDNARGEYIIWVDGDMILSKDFVQKMVNFMDRNPEVGVAKGKYGFVKNFGRKSLVAFLEDVEFMLNTYQIGEAKNKILATSGCIYRLKAIKEVGGFDPRIRGAGEDMDVESKVKMANWKLSIVPVVFQEIRRQSWSELFKEYLWHGEGGATILKRNKHAFDLCLNRMFPPILFMKKMIQVASAYRLTGKKTVLLLPLHYTFKRIAWFFGFIKSLFLRK